MPGLSSGTSARSPTPIHSDLSLKYLPATPSLVNTVALDRASPTLSRPASPPFSPRESSVTPVSHSISENFNMPVGHVFLSPHWQRQLYSPSLANAPGLPDVPATSTSLTSSLYSTSRTKGIFSNLPFAGTRSPGPPDHLEHRSPSPLFSQVNSDAPAIDYGDWPAVPASSNWPKPDSNAFIDDYEAYGQLQKPGQDIFAFSSPHLQPVETPVLEASHPLLPEESHLASPNDTVLSLSFSPVNRFITPVHTPGSLSAAVPSPLPDELEDSSSSYFNSSFILSYPNVDVSELDFRWTRGPAFLAGAPGSASAPLNGQGTRRLAELSVPNLNPTRTRGDRSTLPSATCGQPLRITRGSPRVAGDEIQSEESADWEVPEAVVRLTPPLHATPEPPELPSNHSFAPAPGIYISPLRNYEGGSSIDSAEKVNNDERIDDPVEDYSISQVSDQDSVESWTSREYL
ncbi:hypothetical protein K488DRAFT_86052 [Vararia minispora EC-137]|uniref:Uncharacterized protein n=1 Tax=Vararia minispora EC-137 TaxID=1314806 RepID=A0ACB8QLK5_9AGAM|nr:hypothetical protein K488DRAFT_86052 [Vararia minispora EC-137]